MPAGLVPFDDDRIDAHADELARKAERGCKAEDTSPAPLDAADRRVAWEPACQHDVTNTMGCADVDQLKKLRVKSYQVDTKLTPRHRLGFARQQIRRHRSRSDDPETAGVRDSRDQVALRHPGHGTAHYRQIATE